MCRYPDVKVQLTGEDGNAFGILGKVLGALKKAGVPADELNDFKDEATCGDYDHLIITCMKWVEVS